MLSFSPWLLILLLPWRVQGDEEWGLWSAHNSSSLPLFLPHAFPLLQHRVFSMACGEILAPEPGAPCPFLLLWPRGPQGCILYLFYSLLCSILLFLTHAVPETPPPWLRGSCGLCGGLNGAGWNCVWFTMDTQDMSKKLPRSVKVIAAQKWERRHRNLIKTFKKCFPNENFKCYRFWREMVRI